MKEGDWVRLKYDVSPNEMVCERCGHTALAPMPCGFKEAEAMMTAFYKIHKNCKPKKENIICREAKA